MTEIKNFWQLDQKQRREGQGEKEKIERQLQSFLCYEQVQKKQLLSVSHFESLQSFQSIQFTLNQFAPLKRKIGLN